MTVKALLGRKREMSQVFTADGKVVPVTIVEAGPCPVVQVKSTETKDGYSAYQIGFDDARAKVVAKPQLGHFQKANVGPKRVLREVRFDGEAALKVGDVITVASFTEGELVDVIGTTKGRGFQGGIKRHNFKAGPRGHGTKNTREPGSVGTNTTPGRILKGKRMPGHYGATRVTTRNLKVVKVDTEKHLLFIQGAVPGHNNGDVFVRAAIAASTRKRAPKKK